MTALKDMSVSQAASEALKVIPAGSHIEYQEKYNYRDGQTWQQALADEYEIDLEDEDENPFDDLQDNSSAWQEAKYNNSEYTVDGLTAKTVAEYGGEGDGDQYWVVVSISDGETTRFFRKDGWYASYDGGYLDGETYEVKPQEKLVTVYE